MRRKYEQVKAYSKIIKYKRNTGLTQEVQPPRAEEKLEEERAVVDVPRNEDFEDEFEDEFEQEEGWISDSEEEEVNESGTMMSEGKEQPKKEKEEVFLGNNKNLAKGEILEFDNRAYEMLHRLNVEWPSMSIDFVAKGSPFESLPSYQQMNKYPYEVFTVQGSCNNSARNSIYFTKWSKLHQTKYDDDPDAGNDL